MSCFFLLVEFKGLFIYYIITYPRGGEEKMIKDDYDVGAVGEQKMMIFQQK